MSEKNPLIGTGEFTRRHFGGDEKEVKELLDVVGSSNMDNFMDSVVPSQIRLDSSWKNTLGDSEADFLQLVEAKLDKNAVFRSYLGMGYYNTFTPSVLLRNFFENPGWYTQYTPYQPEISQGRLELLLNFQTMVSDLTGMDLANASLLDEATAAAEALVLLYRAQRPSQGRKKFFVSKDIFPQTLKVLETRAYWLGIELEIGDIASFSFASTFFGMLLQYPDDRGRVEDFESVVQKAHANGIKVAIGTDLLALTLLKPPGEWGVDVVFGSSQRFGVPMGFGGPHAAFFAVKDSYKRILPGRIIGISKDRNGRLAYRMSLQTREQHIRREKATSNICTAQALLANLSVLYAMYHGPGGLKQIALKIHGLVVSLMKALAKLSLTPMNKDFFDTLTYEVKDAVLREDIRQRALAKKINFRFYESIGGGCGAIGIALDETTTIKDIEDIVSIFVSIIGGKESVKTLCQDFIAEAELIRFPEESWEVPSILKRNGVYLTHPIFNSLHSETQMMRYLRELEEKDLSLLNAMIPLGSCTMKLNAAVQMRSISNRKAMELHPFIPLFQAKGYQEIIKELEEMLLEITGFSAISLQPNSGAQGEYAGLVTIRAYQAACGEGERNIALIPTSAHGTNPASAVMAGLKVVLVECNKAGDIDIEDLQRKAEKHSKVLSCLMLTYPSTHGVFEEHVLEITKIIHTHGGKVYLDGANLNAQVGYTNPARIGADICHLNLHKTFAIPHGGGGPGMGPIACVDILAPYLPGHFLEEVKGGKKNYISAANWGSASILLISYGYIRLLGKGGMRQATARAVLNANYLKERLSKHYEILYMGKNSRVAHELILEARGFEKDCGVTVEDIAKRLIDYGFHAPTMSWPVAGTLMIEPTESEDKRELDRFVEALVKIREEICVIAAGKMPRENNLLKNAPHTIEDISVEKWDKPYSREEAVFPVEGLKKRKFWPSVARVDSVYGDKNLVCSCLSVDFYGEQD